MLSVEIKKALETLTLDVKFKVNAGTVTALFGKSGAGKTTTVHSIAGLIRPDDGEITLNNKLLFSHNLRTNLPVYRRQIGFVFQGARLFPHMTVNKNLLFGLPRPNKIHKKITLDMVTKLLDLSSLLDRRPQTLSGGERQRVSIGRALLSQPELLLMDEPLSSIDLHLRAEILPFIQKIVAEVQIPVIYVTHSIEEAIYLADNMILISKGQILQEGSVEAVMNRLDLYPVTGRYDSGTVISAQFLNYDKGFDIGELKFPGGILKVPGLNGKIGDNFRAHVKARDVSVSLKKPKDVSILNLFNGKIIDIRIDNGPQVDILIDIGIPLIARITRKSLSELQLTKGTKLFTMVKAVAIDKKSIGHIQNSIT
ncbi:MAG: molybdenum ABC transporter ATP-binding protein [Alphaproteobacteria bacterium]|nr:molybdenum ABC transporter ATP-binding protein [Alphaproteobacteria bacterium]